MKMTFKFIQSANHFAGLALIAGDTCDWTLGCIALENADVKELFAPDPAGTPVVISADQASTLALRGLLRNRGARVQ